ncbi:hypothetical protein KI387_038494, partial [Taxus chinensis]
MEFGAATLIYLLSLSFSLVALLANAEIHYHTFVIEPKRVTRLCKTHDIITVNGQLPGPTLFVHNGDTLVVKAYNRAQYNATLHWHGVRQLRTGWADGPAYVTQCPIQPGGSYRYRFTIVEQEGTLWWHAHVSWLRATVYGALVIYPRRGALYPFPKPHEEIPLMLGEWWNRDPIAVVTQANLTGAAPNVSDAFTVNGQPGDLYPCSALETFRVYAGSGQTYLVRVVNAALNNELFFKIAKHEFTVVAVDAGYTKPYKTDVMMIAPGQTADILLTADQPAGSYYIAARAYTNQQAGTFDNSTTTAILEYIKEKGRHLHPLFGPRAILPQLPFYNDTATVTKFTRALRSLASREHPVDVPQSTDESLISTVGLGLLPCSPPGNICGGPNGTRISASMNNASFALPATTAMLQAYYFGGVNGNAVFTTDFPSSPPLVFDYTGQNIPRSLWAPVTGTTRVRVLEYNSSVQVVFQGTNIFVADNHPMHVHGYSFYVVGQGFGNFDPLQHPRAFNLVDPPKRNTVGVPLNGWTAIRFKADNPGMWFVHCHLDDHLTWGLAMAFLVKNGPSPLSTLKPPPPDLP